MENYENDSNTQESKEDGEEVASLLVGPVGKVPVKYILDYSKDGQTQEEREEYINLLANLGTGICNNALNYGLPYVASTIPELDAYDIESDKDDPYDYVKPVLITVNQKVAFTVFYHKNLPEFIVNDLTSNLLKNNKNYSIKDFDVLTTMVCLDDSVMTEFAYHTEVAKL